DSLPFGPSTVIVRVAGSRFTLTAAGTAIGCFPIRDITTVSDTSVPSFALHELSDEFQKSSGSNIARNSACASGDDGHNLAANLLLAAGTIAQHTTAGGDDGDAQALQRARQVSHTAVGATAGLGHTVDGVDEPFAALAILEGDVQDALAA